VADSEGEDGKQRLNVSGSEMRSASGKSGVDAVIVVSETDAGRFETKGMYIAWIVCKF
jgi:hypothetical protein